MSDPGITLLQVVAYTIGGVAVVAAVVARFRRTRRTGVTTRANAALPIGSILDRLKEAVRPLLRRVLGSPIGLSPGKRKAVDAADGEAVAPSWFSGEL